MLSPGLAVNFFITALNPKGLICSIPISPVLPPWSLYIPSSVPILDSTIEISFISCKPLASFGKIRFNILNAWLGGVFLRDVILSILALDFFVCSPCNVNKLSLAGTLSKSTSKVETLFANKLSGNCLARPITLPRFSKTSSFVISIAYSGLSLSLLASIRRI